MSSMVKDSTGTEEQAVLTVMPEQNILRFKIGASQNTSIEETIDKNDRSQI
jgi:hypothetical protein